MIDFGEEKPMDLVMFSKLKEDEEKRHIFRYYRNQLNLLRGLSAVSILTSKEEIYFKL